jgi:hypothetical protein
MRAVRESPLQDYLFGRSILRRYAIRRSGIVIPDFDRESSISAFFEYQGLAAQEISD